MASDTIITIENIGKRYRLGGRPNERYTALRDVITAKAKSLVRRNGRDSTSASGLSHLKDDFWALRDVSFEVKQGEVVGIIGRNGAGKSTLLKILSRITEPTEGRVRIKGRVASLLEVGTGFHPELTGRENIFLNGAILGMTRVEIKSKFDEIVAFAETEKFLDTPVKRYSSGMYVRLAFAIAAHLEPEILIVDEVLAVGDAEFQEKCLGKMRAISGREGRTVLFVSHNLSAVANLCSRAALLAEGKLVVDSSAQETIRIYIESSTAGTTQCSKPHVIYERSPGKIPASYCATEIAMFDGNDRPISTIQTMSPVKFRISYDFSAPISQGSIVLVLSTLQGARVFVTESHPKVVSPFAGHGSRGCAECIIANLPLTEGRYYAGVGLAIYNVNLLFWEEHLASFIVTARADATSSYRIDDPRGCLALDSKWKMEN